MCVLLPLVWNVKWHCDAQEMVQNNIFLFPSNLDVTCCDDMERECGWRLVANIQAFAENLTIAAKRFPSKKS